MFRHVVLMKFKAETTDEQRDAVLSGLSLLPGAIGEIRNFAYGPDAQAVEGNFDLAAVVDFDNAAGYLHYAQHPAHQEFLATCVGPILETRAAVQFEL